MADGRQEHYFGLDVREQGELLQSLPVVMGRRAEILKKTSGCVWCWTFFFACLAVNPWCSMAALR